MSLFSRIGNDLTHPFGVGNAPVRTPPPQQQPRRAISTPAPGTRPQFSQQAQQRIMQRNPTQGAQQIARGPIMPSAAPTPKFNPLAAGLSSAGSAVKGLGEGLIATPKYFVKSDIINPATEVAAQFSGNKAIKQAAIQHSNIDLGLGAKGNQIGAASQRFGANAAQTGLSVALPDVGGVVGKSFANVAPKVVPKLITKTVANAGTGAITGLPFGVASYYGQNGPHTVQGAIHSGVAGSQAGAVLGTAGTLAKPTIKATVKGGKAAIDVATPKYNGLPAKQVIMDPAKLDVLNAAKNYNYTEPGRSVQAGQDIVNGLHQIKQDHGLDFIKYGPNASRQEAIAHYLEQNGEAIPQLQAHQAKVDQALMRGNPAVTQGGYVKNPLSDEPLKAPAPSTKLVPPQPDAAPVKLPQTTKLEAVKPVSGALGKSKTGVVDKQLTDIQQSRKSMVNYTAEEIRNASKTQPGVRDLIGKNGVYVGKDGLPEDFRDLPAHMRSKDTNKNTLDVWATNLGYHNEDELLQAIADNKAGKPLTKVEAVAEAEKQLASGQHPYSADFKQIETALKQRQDELSQYPNGKYRQVKVTQKPSVLSDAELQSLAKTPEGVAPKTTNKVTVRNEKKVLRNADAERQVQDLLKKGASTDEAVAAYKKSTGTDLQTAVHDVKRVANESDLGFSGGKNPLEGTVKLPNAANKDQAFTNAQFVEKSLRDTGQKALDAFHGLSEHDQTLLQKIETDTVPNVAKKANDSKAFTEAEKQIRTYYDTRHAYGKYLGEVGPEGNPIGYRQNYLRQLFAKADEQAKLTQPEQQIIGAGNKRSGYTKHREYDTLNTHVGTALERDINGSSFNHAKLAYAKGLEEAFPGKTNNSGQLVRGDTGEYLQLQNKYGKGITAAPEVAKLINARIHPDAPTGKLAKYDTFNAGAKQVKLGGGAFHAVTEAGTFIGQQITSGNIFKEPKASANAFRSFFSHEFITKENARLASDHATNPDGLSTADRATLSGLKSSPRAVQGDAAVNLMNKGFKYTGIKALHEATFGRELPFMKMKTFEQKTKGLSIHNPADRVKMQDIATGINNEIGGLNRDLEGSIKPSTFQRVQRFLLATDFTEGKIRTIMAALSKGGEQGKLAREIVAGKAVLFGGLTVAGGAAFGDYKNKSGKQNAVQIAKSLIDPSFKAGRYSVALPNTYASEFIRPFEPFFKSKAGSGQNATTADRFKGIQKYGINRLAAAPSEALQLISNKDASGNRIYGKDYKSKGGENISPLKTAANVAGTAVPIPASQGIGVATGKTQIAPAIANIAGLRVTNEDQYNQNATPVQIKTGDNPVTLPKDKAIAYNKAVADQQTALDKQLESSNQYKSANATDQADMKKKLHGYITDWQQRSFASANNIPINKQISNSVNAVSNNTLPDNLAKGANSNSTPIAKNLDGSSKQFLTKYNGMTGDQRTKAANNQNDFEYKYEQAKYNNDKANNKLSAAQDIKAQDSLAKAQIGSQWSKNVRDLWGLNKSDLYTYLNTSEAGKDKATTAARILAYDKALTDAGLQTKGKFHDKYGNVTLNASNSSGTIGKKKSSGGSSKSSGLAAISKSKVSYASLGKSNKSYGKFKIGGSKGISTSVKLASYKAPKANHIKKPRGVLA